MASARLVLVRHGRPSATYLEDRDPGLDDEGRAQAESMAALLAFDGPRLIVSSPMRRARETATPLEAQWNVTARIDVRVAEIPAPIDELTDRGAWLRDLLGRNWSELDDRLHRWRVGIREALTVVDADTVVMTHYLVINTAVTLATGDDRLVVFRPDHCSRTVFDVIDRRLHLVELGAGRATKIG